MSTNYTRKALTGTAVVFALGAGASILAYLLRLILARSLGPAEYGLIYAVFAFFGLFSIFQHLGLQEALVRHIAEFRVQSRLGAIKGAIIFTARWQFATALALAVLGAVFAEWLAQHYFHDPLAVSLVQLYAISIALSPLDIIAVALFQGWQRMDLFSLLNFTRMAFILAATWALLRLGYASHAPIIAYITVYAIHLLIFYPLFFTRIFPTFRAVKTSIDAALQRSLFSYGIAVLFTMAAGIIITYTDTAMLTAMRPLAEVGLYNVAAPTVRVLWLFAQSLSFVLLPLSTELWLRKPHYLPRGMSLVYRYAALIIVPAALVMLVFPDLLLRILFGAAYAPAAEALRILAVAAVLFTFAQVNIAVISGIGKPQANSVITWVAAGGNALGNLLFIPSMGIAGAALSSLIAFALILVLSTVFLRKHVTFALPWLDWAKTLIAGGAFMAVLILLKNALTLTVWPELTISVGAAALTYAVLVLAFRAFSPAELKALIRRARA